MGNTLSKQGPTYSTTSHFQMHVQDTGAVYDATIQVPAGQSASSLQAALYTAIADGSLAVSGKFSILQCKLLTVACLYLLLASSSCRQMRCRQLTCC